MNMKSVSGGLIMAMAAAGAVATAPAASAHEHRKNRTTCTMSAKAFRGADTGFGRGDRAKLKVTFTLRSNGDRKGTNLWKVVIRQNREEIDRRYLLTDGGSLSLVKVARDTYRRDRFTATATNFRTGQKCRAAVYDPGMRL